MSTKRSVAVPGFASSGIVRKREVVDPRFEYAHHDATVDGLGHNHLFEAATRLPRGWAARHPLALLLDDMQWADMATLDLLLYIAQSLAQRPAPILLLLNLRTGTHTLSEPQPSWVMALKRTGIGLTVLGLTPFTQEETLRFVQTLAWGEVQPEAEHNYATERVSENEDRTVFEELLASFAHWLYLQTHGQPFSLIETLKGLIEQEILAPSLQKDGTWGLMLKYRLLTQTPMSALVPASVREVICSQFGQLTSSARALLIAGAVIREGLTFERLCQVAQFDEETGLHALEEVLQSEWLCEDNGAAIRKRKGAIPFLARCSVRWCSSRPDQFANDSCSSDFRQSCEKRVSMLRMR